ncbi:MAG: hypothetical protein A2085_00990 [Gemmatimonadetes bacterium GWC2_71_10]|nr:MAG: hypothetical protein A2085_00990 [Gemmatimonadetes bacterium GWC2_71_10]
MTIMPACATRVVPALLAILAAPLAAQQVRLHTSTTARYVQLRPIAYDSASGTFRALPVAAAAPLTEDVEVSAWGLGITGLRAYALLRGRAALGSELVWPRFDDHVQTMVAFVELERPRYRVRAGRQHRASGLGWYAFDGLAGTWRMRGTFRAEVYGGRGYARGFLEPAGSEALRAVDPLQPEQGRLLFGASLWAAPTRASALTAVYQREILSDRSGLVSERAALDARIGLGPVLITGAVDADLATEQWGKARLAALVRLRQRSFLEAEVFRYRPILDLTTIWGVFSPEAHWGVTATARFGPARGVTVSGGWTHRRYEPVTSTTPFLRDVGDDADQLTAGVRLTPGDLVLDAGYRLQLGFGGAQSGGDLVVAYAPPGWRIGARAAAFQQQELFRVADGTVVGLGAEFAARLTDRLAVRADMMRYLHRRLEGQVGADWSQTRGQLAVDWTFGANPDRPRTYP